MSPVMLALLDARTVLARVERRIIDAGAVVEAHQFAGLSADEVDTLLWLERNDPVVADG